MLGTSWDDRREEVHEVLLTPAYTFFLEASPRRGSKTSVPTWVREGGREGGREREWREGMEGGKGRGGYAQPFALKGSGLNWL